jgi:hypothetical protein
MVRRKLDLKELAKYGTPPPGAEERLRKAGFTDGPEDEPAPFGFGTLMQSTLEVGNDAAQLLDDIRDRIVQSLRGISWTSKLDGLLLSPKIIDPRIGEVEDFVARRRGGEVDVGKNIDYQAWQTADRAERLRLMAANIRESFETIREKYLSPADFEAVMNALDKAVAELS